MGGETPSPFQNGGNVDRKALLAMMYRGPRGEDVMRLKFRFKRSMQAVAYLLKLDGGTMNYTKLIKMLYIADREWMAKRADPITGDVVFAMKMGPVLSDVLHLIKDEHELSRVWSQFIRTNEDDKSVTLIDDPGDGELSTGVIAKLGDVYEKYRKLDYKQISSLTHTFPEWIQHDPGKKSRKLIPWEDILRAQGREKMISYIEDATREDAEIDYLTEHSFVASPF